MSTRSSRITLNFTSILLGRGVGLFLNLFAVIFAARYLGVENYGLFSATLSMVYILTKFIDFGFSPIVTRETAKDLNNYEYLNNAISLRIILFFLLLIISNVSFQIFHLKKEEIVYSNILFLNIILSSRFLSFRELLEIPFKVHLRMHIVALLNFLDNFLLLILILFIPYANDKLLYYVVSFSLANLPGFIGLLIILKKKLNYHFQFQLNKKNWLIRQSIPLMGYVLLLSFFQQIDIVLTKHYISEVASGLYAVGIRLTQPFTVFPVAIVNTTIPLIVSANKNDSKNAKHIIRLVYKLLLLLSFITATVFSFKAKDLVLLLFGESYLPAYKVVIILAWSNLFLFYNFFTVELLTVFSAQKKNFIFALILVVLDVGFFYLFYSELDYLGAAVARTLATLGGAVFLWSMQQQKIFRKIKILNFRFVIAATLILLVALLLSTQNLVLYILFVSIISPLLFWMFKFLDKEEMETLFNVFKIKKLSPFLYSTLMKIYH